jgi:hypothetical protein
MPIMKHDARVHKRFLDYRESHQYFGKLVPILDYDAFAKLDEELLELEKKGDSRDDEEEARLAELASILFRD